MRFDNWIDELHELSAAAPEWDAAPCFLQSLQALTSAKQKERQAWYHSVERALEQLRTECSRELHYFGASECAGWSAASCQMAALPGQSEQLERFHGLLSRNATLRRQLVETLVDDQLRLETLEQLGQQIAATYDSLAAGFSAQPVPAKSENEHPSTAEEAPLRASSEPEGDVDGSGDYAAALSNGNGHPLADPATWQAAEVEDARPSIAARGDEIGQREEWEAPAPAVPLAAAAALEASASPEPALCLAAVGSSEATAEARDCGNGVDLATTGAESMAQEMEREMAVAPAFGIAPPDALDGAAVPANGTRAPENVAALLRGRFFARRDPGA